MAMEYDYYEQHIHHPNDPIVPAKTRWIWNIFWLLLAVTTVEVSLAFANYYQHFGIDQILKVIYIVLTLVKAGFIIFWYMHLKDEKKSFKFTLGALVVILTYFIVLMLNEGYHQNVVHYDFPVFMQRDPSGLTGH